MSGTAGLMPGHLSRTVSATDEVNSSRDVHAWKYQTILVWALTETQNSDGFVWMEFEFEAHEFVSSNFISQWLNISFG